MIVPIAFLAITSVAMVGAMVQFMYSLVADDSRQAEHRALWGALYLASWAGVSIALWDLIRRERVLTSTDWTAIVLAPVGWLTFNALWVAAWGALEVRYAEARRDPVPERARRLRRQGWSLGKIGLAATAVLLVGLGVPGAIVRALDPLAHLPLTIVVAMIVVGWALLIVGGVRLAIGSGATHHERFGALGEGRSASGEFQVTFAEVKDAWQRKAWATDGRWRTFFLMALGAALIFYGAFGLMIVNGPWLADLLAVGAMVYATFRIADGFRRI